MKRRPGIFATTFPRMTCCWRAFPASRFPGGRVEEERTGPRTRVCLRYLGTLFFDVARIIDARRPAIFVLENVKT